MSSKHHHSSLDSEPASPASGSDASWAMEPKKEKKHKSGLAKLFHRKPKNHAASSENHSVASSQASESTGYQVTYKDLQSSSAPQCWSAQLKSSRCCADTARPAAYMPQTAICKTCSPRNPYPDEMNCKPAQRCHVNICSSPNPAFITCLGKLCRCNGIFLAMASIALSVRLHGSVLSRLYSYAGSGFCVRAPQ